MSSLVEELVVKVVGSLVVELVGCNCLVVVMEEGSLEEELVGLGSLLLVEDSLEVLLVVLHSYLAVVMVVDSLVVELVAKEVDSSVEELVVMVVGNLVVLRSCWVEVMVEDSLVVLVVLHSCLVVVKVVGNLVALLVGCHSCWEVKLVGEEGNSVVLLVVLHNHLVEVKVVDSLVVLLADCHMNLQLVLGVTVVGILEVMVEDMKGAWQVGFHMMKMMVSKEEQVVCKMNNLVSLVELVGYHKSPLTLLHHLPRLQDSDTWGNQI